MKILKRIVAIFLVVMLCGQSFAAVVSDNDGSAFITKAEFDSLKNNFQSQIDGYNSSIDSKIDGAIAGYLAGINMATPLTQYVTSSTQYKFKNDMQTSSQRADSGMLSLSHQRLAGITALTGVNTTIGTLTASNCVLRFALGSGYWSDPSISGTYSDLIHNNATAVWDTAHSTNDRFAAWNQNTQTAHWTDAILTNPKQTLYNALSDMGLISNDIKMSLGSWHQIMCSVVSQCLQDGEQVNTYRGKTETGYTTGVAVPPTTSTPTTGRVNTLNIYSNSIINSYGIGWGVDMKNSVPYLSKYYPKVSIMNTYDLQNFTYKNASSQTTSDSAWNDTSNIGLTITPSSNFDIQSSGTKEGPNTTSTSASSTYYNFQATQLKMGDDTQWDNTCQLGTTTNASSILCFDESCDLGVGSQETVAASTLRFNRTGYYMNGNNLVTKNDNYVLTGDVKYKRLIWNSTYYSPSQIALDSLSSITGDKVYLGGGVPLAKTNDPRTGIKIKYTWFVTKADGSAINEANTVTVTISDKQFSSGSVASGASTLASNTINASASTNTGSITTDGFEMAQGSQLWLNAYSSKQGYIVGIKDIQILE